MSKRYIPQTPNNDFVYANNDKVEYDQEIIHEINDNTVSGSISGLTLTYDGGNVDLQYTYTWNKNNAEVWIRNSNQLALLSVHVLAPGQEYFKPWKIWDSVSTSTLTGSTYTSTITRTISPLDVGLTGFPNGEYIFEFRFIGKLQPYVVCATATLSGSPVTPTPTPTPTLTPGPDTPTPTPTQTPTPTPTGGCTIWELRGPTYSGEILEVEYIPCGATGTTTTQVFWNSTPQYEYICAEIGSVSILDNGINGAATNTGTVCVAPTPTPTATPTPSPTPITIYVSSIQTGCTEFCTTNYLINSLKEATGNYASLGIGDTISDLGGTAGWLAYASYSTDTDIGAFKVAEVDSSGTVLGISECVGSSCVPL